MSQDNWRKQLAISERKEAEARKRKIQREELAKLGRYDYAIREYLDQGLSCSRIARIYCVKIDSVRRFVTNVLKRPLPTRLKPLPRRTKAGHSE